jgi:hypothetical protein
LSVHIYQCKELFLTLQNYSVFLTYHLKLPFIFFV